MEPGRAGVTYTASCGRRSNRRADTPRSSISLVERELSNTDRATSRGVTALTSLALATRLEGVCRVLLSRTAVAAVQSPQHKRDAEGVVARVLGTHQQIAGLAVVKHADGLRGAGEADAVIQKIPL